VTPPARKRFIVHERIYDAFQRDFVSAFQKLKVGDPMREETDVGPLATPDILKILEEQVSQSVAKGARLLIGGKRIPGPGNYYAPAILADIPKSARAYSEELFGPVALLFKVQNIDQAIQLANESPFGLGSSVWTQDDTERKRFIEELEAGQTFINSMVASDPRLPFGGVKRSGYGRELGREGIREFVNIKTVQVAEIRQSNVE
jgi:succinate-semialdehyde dehydrogenase/glutarate-semialdehyde dehydrogenase